MNYAFYNDDLQDAKHMVTYIIPMPCWGDRPRDVIPQVLGADALALSPPFQWRRRNGQERQVAASWAGREAPAADAERGGRAQSSPRGQSFRV